MPELGFLTWSDCMLPSLHGINASGSLQGLTSAAPIVLFDLAAAAATERADADVATHGMPPPEPQSARNRQRTSLVVSPLDNFKSVVHTNKPPTATSPVGAWETGVNSEVASLPPGFVHRTLVMLGSHGGISAAMVEWGSLLQDLKGTNRSIVDEDPTVHYLSYWTDNGAYYYGDAWKAAGGGGPVANETSMLAVAAGLEANKLLKATKIWQLDDWWYLGPQSVYVHCVANWTFGPHGFHSTLADLSKAVHTPWLLYVPFFCGEQAGGNVYEKQGFKFVQGVPGVAQFSEPHPDNAEAFYDMLFEYGVASGMQGFENDFLNYNLLSIPHFRTVYDASSKWLLGMNAAAVKRRLPLQMCMALPSDIMASLELNAVTNYRGSTDYAFSGSNFNVGGSGLLGYALGVRPSKDNFWTTRPESSVVTGKPWGVHSNPGSNNELNAIVATFSTGPFGIADKAGTTNLTIVLRGCRSDGLIIQPDRPATHIDSMFDSSTWLGAETTFSHKTGQQNAHGHVWTTHAAVRRGRSGKSTGLSIFYVLSIDLHQGWQLSEDDFYPAMSAASGWVVHRWSSECANGANAVSSGCVLPTSVWNNGNMPTIVNDRPIAVANDTLAFDIHQFAPIVPGSGGWVLLGDLDRYVPVSSKRFSNISAVRRADGREPGGAPVASTLSVSVMGVPAESVRITALQPKATLGSSDGDGDGGENGGDADGGGSMARTVSTGKAVSEWVVVVKKVTFPKGCKREALPWQGKPTSCVEVVTF